MHEISFLQRADQFILACYQGGIQDFCVGGRLFFGGLGWGGYIVIVEIVC